MARILLIMPPMPQAMGAPYLGQLYVAASARAAGHEVRCLDLAAPLAPQGQAAVDAAKNLVKSFRPDITGMTLFTYGALAAYRLAKALGPDAGLLVAGGPHPTVLPEEPVVHGFDVAIAGEGEHAIVALAAAVDAGTDLHRVPGVTTRGQGGASGSTAVEFLSGPPSPMLTGEDLDALPFPHTAYDCFDMAVYTGDGNTVVSGGIMSSRGCPARCTFCANYVTGRGYRFRSTQDIVAEIETLRATYGINNVPFWDDAFTARRPRLNDICDAFINTPALRGMTWTVITPGNMVKPFDLQRMRAAGCVAINFGIESGDLNVLKAIQKGQRPQQVFDAVRAAKDAGMQTIVNFMFGFPEEGVTELGNTLAFMERLAPHTDYFNTRGVLVPFPGTAVYDRWHESYDLAGWWLDPANIPVMEATHIKADNAADDGTMDPLAAMRRERFDSTVDRDYFRYTPEIREMINRCVAFKADHNIATVKGYIDAA